MKIILTILLTVLFSTGVFMIGEGLGQIMKNSEPEETLCDWVESRVWDNTPQTVINRPGVLTVTVEPSNDQIPVPIRLTKEYVGMGGRWVLTWVDVSKYDPKWQVRPCLLKLGYKEKTVGKKTVNIVPRYYNGCWIYTQLE